MNDVMRRWMDDGMVWLPEKGVGYLKVVEAPYDADYFAKYERYAESEMGRAITRARVDLVRRHLNIGTVCDVGIGCGDFVKAMGCFGYDINPVGEEWLVNSGRWLDPWHNPVDALTFWDCLEHIENPAPLLANARHWVFLSIPIVPGDGPPPKGWKHTRPDEHCLYFTRDGLIRFMAEHGFVCVEHSTAESLIGREDVGSFAFRRAA